MLRQFGNAQTLLPSGQLVTFVAWTVNSRRVFAVGSYAHDEPAIGLTFGGTPKPTTFARRTRPPRTLQPARGEEDLVSTVLSCP
jgi:hypothetical protein